jgi:ribosome recycling factor
MQGMSEEFDLSDLQRRMQGAISVFKNELSGLRTGRASISLLDPVVVTAYGSTMPLNQLATVSVPESRMLSVQVWDRSMVNAVEKAIRESSLGLNPITEGTLLRLPIPELNTERRKELAKLAHKYAEATRVSVRHVRRDGMDELKDLEKEGLLSEDSARAYSERVQKLTDDTIAEIDRMLASKEQEIMQV